LLTDRTDNAQPSELPLHRGGAVGQKSMPRRRLRNSPCYRGRQRG